MKRSLDEYHAVLCDLDGCLISGRHVLPGARALVNRVGARLWILSNNSTDTPLTLGLKLSDLGLPVAQDRILLAGTFTIDQIAARRPRPRLCLYGTPELRQYAASLGLTTDDPAPDCVVLARDLAFSYPALERLVGQLANGARMLVTNEDGAHPSPDGSPVPETGALLAAVKTCVPEIGHESFGKPHASMYRHVLARAGVEPEHALAIGDNPATDGLGAMQAGVDFVLVGPGRRFGSLAALLA